jgi:hypothetical protein
LGRESSETARRFVGLWHAVQAAQTAGPCLNLFNQSKVEIKRVDQYGVALSVRANDEILAVDGRSGSNSPSTEW